MVSDHSHLSVPGEFEGRLFDMDVDHFKRESQGKEVHVIMRNGVVDSIEPANHDAPQALPGPGGSAPHHPGQPGPHGGPQGGPPPYPGQPGPHGGPQGGPPPPPF